MFLARQIAAVVTGLLPLAGAISVSLLSATQSRAENQLNGCDDAAELAVMSSPVSPWKGAALRVAFALEKPIEGEFTLTSPNGSIATRSRVRHGGPPYYWYGEVNNPGAGTWRATLTRDNAPPGCATITREIAVRNDEPPRPRTTAGSLWPLRNTWNRGTESLYSAWIEKLFDAPLEAEPSWKALHEVLRDRSRNMLFNHLGLREDELGLIIRPDCADLPYFLRAYFAFKMGLPFGYSVCTRGTGGDPPTCVAWWNIQNLQPEVRAQDSRAQDLRGVPAQGKPEPPVSLFDMFRGPSAPPPPPPPARGTAKPPAPAAKPLGLAASFGQYVRSTVADAVHSGSGRTTLADNNTDYYPVPLNADALRPGTVYADPYGHMLVLVARVPQSDGQAGVLLAVDAQPDGTVARKRFWRGNFLFAQDPALGGPGFKRFRPIVRDKNGTLRRLTNDEIAKNAEYADYSLDQSRLAIEDFYDRMDDVISPSPLDPLGAMKEAITALEEQVKARVTSVENGRKYQSSGRGDAEMPDGAAIFETTGAWEDFATPSRDLRLLIAVDVVRGFPDRVMRRPERYAMPKDKSLADVTAELQTVLASELAVRKFSYTRSNGSAWTLALKDVLDRITDLEMAYNLNDCVELRWGAPERSDEAATCKRHAPRPQRAKMGEYRAWFHERRRPPRA
jgi:hypothetical protein